MSLPQPPEIFDGASASQGVVEAFAGGIEFVEVQRSSALQTGRLNEVNFETINRSQFPRSVCQGECGASLFHPQCSLGEEGVHEAFALPVRLSHPDP